MEVLAGSTDITTYFKLRLAADGTAATGLTIADLDLQYVRSGATPAAKVDAVALAAADTAHTDNRAIEIDATDQPGLYRVDWPDAAFAAGVREVILTVKHATIFTEELRVNLTPVPANATLWNSLTTVALPLAPTTAGRTLDVAATGEAGLDFDNIKAATGATTLTNITVPTVTTLTNLPAITANWLTAAGIAAAALNGKGDWNIGKTGYSLTQSFPANFAALGINASGHVERVVLVDTTIANTDMRGTNNAALASVCTEARLAELDAANLPADVATRATPAQVNAEVLDVLTVDTFAQPGQEAPAATTTIGKMVAYLYKSLRNKKTQTATERKLFADDGTTVDQKATDSDDATTYTKGELGAGP